MPRGADAVVMVEQTTFGEDTDGPYVDIHRPVSGGSFIAFAGSDIGRGEIVLRQGVELDIPRDRHSRRMRFLARSGGPPSAGRHHLDGR